MDTLLKKFWNAMRRDRKRRDHRRLALRQSPHCDSLEGRQLLSGMGMGGMMATQHVAMIGHSNARAALRQARLRHGAGAQASAQPHFQADIQTLPGMLIPSQAQPTNTAPTTPPTNTPTPTTTTTTSTTTSAPAGTTPQVQAWYAGMPGGQGGAAFGMFPYGPSMGSGTTTASGSNTPTPSNQPTTPPTNTALTSALDTLRTDVHAIMAKSQVTVAETVALSDDLQAIQKASTSAPSQTTVQAFQKDLTTIEQQGSLPTDAQKTQLTTDFTAMVNSQGVTDQTLIDKTISDAEAILASSGVTNDDLAKIAADQKAIQTAMGSNGTNAPTPGQPGLPGMGMGMGMGIGFDALMGMGGFDTWQLGMPPAGGFVNAGFLTSSTSPGTPGGTTTTTTVQPGTSATPPSMSVSGVPGPGGPMGAWTTWTGANGGMSMGQMPMGQMPMMGMGGRMMAWMGGPMMQAPNAGTTAPAPGGTTSNPNTSGGTNGV